MKKKLLALLLATTVAATGLLGGCGAGESAQPSTPEAGGQAVSNDAGQANAGSESGAEPAEISGDLLIWLNDVDYANALIEAFTSKYPKVNIEFERVDAVSAGQKLALDGPAGIGPDILHIGDAGMAIADGHIEPLPADMQARMEELLLEPALDMLAVGGRLYGVPFALENMAIFYNKDLIESPPETFEEIFEFASTYNDPALGKYALRLQPENFFGNYVFLTAFGYSIFGPNGDDWKNPGFDSKEMADGLQFFKSLREVYDVNAVDGTYDAVYGAFDRGEVPLVFNGPWGITSAKAGDVNFGIAKFPTINGVQPLAFSTVQAVSISSYAKNFDAAFAFAEFMVSLEGAQILCEVLGSVVSLKDISGVPGLADDEISKGFAEQARYTVPMPMIPEMQLTWAVIMPMLSFVWDGDLSVDEAQKKAMEDFEIVLNASGQSMYD
ncbi:MAG: maltose ABC transporter substrate-binding protein [Lachnospiraceae bacterium]|nr:maltose ABC transporter substrate-binding protein [Lachnospiraceae bacterium]